MYVMAFKADKEPEGTFEVEGRIKNMRTIEQRNRDY